MSFFARPHSKSEATLFIEQLKIQNPELEAQQLAGRALLWEQKVNSNTQEEFQEGRVAQNSYVYQTQNK